MRSAISLDTGFCNNVDIDIDVSLDSAEGHLETRDQGPDVGALLDGDTQPSSAAANMTWTMEVGGHFPTIS